MRPAARDEGSVLLLVIGLTAVLLLLVAVVVDVSVVILAHRSVASTADGAAVAAAQQPAVEVIRDEGLGDRLTLDATTVAQVVQTYAADAQDDQPGLALEPSLPDDATVLVRATRQVRLPFVGWLGVEAVTVSAVGRAESPVVP